MLSKIYENIEKRNFNCCQNYAVDVIGRQTRCTRANIQARKRCAQNAIRNSIGFLLTANNALWTVFISKLANE